MSANKIYLITGANRGLGQGLVQSYLLRPNTTVIAGVRDPSASSSQSLTSLPTGSGSQLVIVKLDSASPTDPSSAASTLQTKHSINHIDVLIANAGISDPKSLVPARSTALDALKEHMAVNGHGPILLFQAFYDMLFRSSSKPIFIGIGSAMGAVAGMEERAIYPGTAYGMSKAALHWFVRKVHFEEQDKGLIAFALDPGFAQTDMGNDGARLFGMEKAFQEVGDTVEGMVKVVSIYLSGLAMGLCEHAFLLIGVSRLMLRTRRAVERISLGRARSGLSKTDPRAYFADARNHACTTGDRWVRWSSSKKSRVDVEIGGE